MDFRLLSRGNRPGLIALSCHFALDLLCYKEGCMILHDASSGTIVHEVSLCLWHHCHPDDIVILWWLTRSLQNFAQHIRPFAGTVHSGMESYPSVVLVNLEVYLFGRTFPVSLCCPVQVVPISYTVQDRSVPEDCSYRWGTAVTKMVKPWSPSDPSLCNCPASLSDVFLR